LSEHKEIYDIDISGTNVSDISFIENFEELTQLSIAVCPIEDYSPLFTTKSRLKHLEIDRKALEKIGEEKIRSRHIGINIRVTNNSPFWYL
jgi:Leucine-rich repeat (LRR) protein